MTQTSTDFDKSLNYLLDEEGGWSDHPSDRGGATFNGVTQATYDAWRTKKKLPKQSVRNASAAEIKDLYFSEYWTAAACDRLPWPLSYVTFDAAVNSGPSRATTWLQAGLGVTTDGKVGPKTLAAAQSAVASGVGPAVRNSVQSRSDFLGRIVQQDRSQADFLVGWWRRTLRVLERALT